jgi:hypothetical protein
MVGRGGIYGGLHGDGTPVASPREPNGRLLSAKCPDPNCSGTLQEDTFFGRPVWTCDGLTHDTDDGPLRACSRMEDRLTR